jgi:hypothetical protein
MESLPQEIMSQLEAVYKTKKDADPNHTLSYDPDLSEITLRSTESGDKVKPLPLTIPTWRGLLVKAFKTFIQGATAVLLAGTLNLFDTSALEAAWTGGFAALISFANNWASAKEG